MLCWVLVEQARHEHMSDEYKNRYNIVVLLKPSSWVNQTNTRSPQVVPSEMTEGMFQRLWGGRYDDSILGEVTKTTTSGDKTTSSPTWSASLPRIELILQGG